MAPEIIRLSKIGKGALDLASLAQTVEAEDRPTIALRCGNRPIE